MRGLSSTATSCSAPSSAPRREAETSPTLEGLVVLLGCPIADHAFIGIPMTASNLALLPQLSLRVEAPTELTPSWPVVAAQGGGFCLGAELRLFQARTACPDDGHLLEAREPELGWYRLNRWTPLSVECGVGENAPRAIDTAIRLCALLCVWARGGLLLHAAGLARDGRAFLCLAPSSGGKSTLTTLADGFDSLSDETVAIVPAEDGATFECWSTPFRSASPRPPRPMVAALSALLVLDKAPLSRATPLSGLVAAQAILRQAYTAPPLAGDRATLLNRAARVATAVKALRFQFPKSDAARSLLDDIAAGHVDTQALP